MRYPDRVDRPSLRAEQQQAYTDPGIFNEVPPPPAAPTQFPVWYPDFARGSFYRADWQQALAFLELPPSVPTQFQASYPDRAPRAVSAQPPWYADPGLVSEFGPQVFTSFPDVVRGAAFRAERQQALAGVQAVAPVQFPVSYPDRWSYLDRQPRAAAVQLTWYADPGLFNEIPPPPLAPALVQGYYPDRVARPQFTGFAFVPIFAELPPVPTPPVAALSAQTLEGDASSQSGVGTLSARAIVGTLSVVTTSGTAGQQGTVGTVSGQSKVGTGN